MNKAKKLIETLKSPPVKKKILRGTLLSLCVLGVGIGYAAILGNMYMGLIMATQHDGFSNFIFDKYFDADLDLIDEAFRNPSSEVHKEIIEQIKAIKPIVN